MKMIKKIFKSKWCVALMVIFWLILLWVRTFFGITNGYDEGSTFGVLGSSLWTVFVTVFYGLCMVGLFLVDEETNTSRENPEEKDEITDTEEADAKDGYSLAVLAHNHLKISQFAVLALAGFCLFSIAVSVYAGWLDFFSDDIYMNLGIFEVNKKYIFGILMMIVFPVWATIIIRKIRDTEFNAGAVASGSIQILVLSLLEFMFFMHLSNMWILEIAIVNIVTLMIAVKTYAWKDTNRKGNCVALISAYAVFWGILLSTFYHSGLTFITYVTNETYFNISLSYSYLSNVNKIVNNASFLGQSTVLSGDPYVLQFLSDKKTVILSTLFYGGWLPTIALIAIEILFGISTAAVLFRYKKKDGMDVMFTVAWLGILIRIVGGTLYSFGVPVPILTPFTGTIGIYEDSISVGLLLLCWLIPKSEELMELLCLKDEEDWDEEDENEEADE